eukprot:Em0006g617a
MMRGTSLSLVISLVVIAKAVQLSAQHNEVGTSNEPFNFIVMVMEGDDAGMFDFNVLLDLQRKWFDYQGQRADLERQFNIEVQQLLQDYSSLAAALSSLHSAPMLGSPGSVLADHFEMAFHNLTANKQEKAHVLIERYNQAVADYLAPKGEQAMDHARTLITVSVGVYSQFVMRLGAYLSQLETAADSCLAHYGDIDDVDITCFKREVKILEDFIYQLILKIQMQPPPTFPTTTTTTTTGTSTTEITSTPPTTATSTPGTSGPVAGSGSGDEETTKPPNPHLLPIDDEDSTQEPSATSNSSKSAQAQLSTTTPVGITGSTEGIVIKDSSAEIVITAPVPIVAHQELPTQPDAEQATSPPLAAEHRVEAKGRHGHNKETLTVNGSVTIVGQPSNSTTLADLSIGVSAYAPMLIVLICCAVGLLSVVTLVTVVCSVMHSRRNRQGAKGRVPLTEEEVVENMKKDGFVNPTYTFFSN